MKRFTLRLLTLALLGLVVASTHATHFRFGHVTWRRVGGNTSRTVEITVTEAWRASAVTPSELQFSWGDGTGFFHIGVGFTTVATLTDLNGEAYTIVRKSQTHTYATDGPFTVSANSCCRISSLINAGDASEQLSAVVDLRNGNQGSPVASIPVILQMGIGMNSVALPISDPDLDPFTVRLSTSAESLIPTQPQINASQVISVTPDGILNWNTTGGVPGRKYAVQVMIQENRQGGIGRVPLDFIIELIPANANKPPVTTCPAQTSYVIPPGTPLNLSFTGTDPEGLALRVNHLGIPSGATFSPAAGSTGPSPLTASFSWTPTLADRGSAHSVTVVFTDSLGQQSTCAFSVAVPADAPPTVDCGSDVLLSATGTHTQNILVEDADGDAVEYEILVNGILTASGIVPAGLPPTSVTIPFTHSYGLGNHIVEVTVSDFFFSSTCSFAVDVRDVTPPSTTVAVRPLASGKILTLGVTDDFDPNPEIRIRDSVSGVVFGPYSNGNQVIVRQNPTQPPYAATQSGYAARLQIQGQPLIFATDDAGNSSPELPAPH